METQNHDVIDILPHACIESLFLCSPIWREKKNAVSLIFAERLPIVYRVRSL